MDRINPMKRNKWNYARADGCSDGISITSMENDPWAVNRCATVPADGLWPHFYPGWTSIVVLIPLSVSRHLHGMEWSGQWFIWSSQWSTQWSLLVTGHVMYDERDDKNEDVTVTTPAVTCMSGQNDINDINDINDNSVMEGLLKLHIAWVLVPHS